MSSAKGTKAAREPVVQRLYATSPESCAAAVTLLLQSPADKKKAASVPSADGDDTKERSVHDFRATNIIQD